MSRAPGAERVVTPLELFFDLVYVFAIAQLSHHLVEHVDLRTGAETLVMALAVALIAAVLWTPYLLVHHLRGHHLPHLSLLKYRLRVAGRALVDLAPHRIHADARKLNTGR